VIAQVITLPPSGPPKIEDASAVVELADDQIVWIDVIQPDQNEIDWLRDRFQVHPMAVRDIEHHRQRPKLDEYGETSFGVLYAVGSEDTKGPRRRLQMHELQMLLARNHLVTIHWADVPAVEEVTARVKSGELRSIAHGAKGLTIADLTYELCDAVVDGYFPALDALAEASEDIEDEMFSKHRSADTLEAIFHLKKDLFHVRKVVAPARDVMNIVIRRDQHLFPDEYLPYFQDLYDRSNRVIDGLDTCRDILSSALDTYLSFVSNDVNQTVKKMTAVTAILMVDALIAGIYGMNFVHMPELQWQYGYFYSLLLMLAATVGLWMLFRRIRWF
jgi:magnesium transporter